MQIHVQRGEQELGIFSPEQTTQYLAEGRFLETDLAWHEGMEDKVPVAQLLKVLQEENTPTFDEERTVAPELTGEGVKAKEGEVHPVFGGGRYKREKLLGQGGMGQVWLAYDKQLERQVAVKMVSKKYAANQKALNALKAEVQKSLELTHPGIIRIYDLNETPGEDPFISMEYIEGEELFERKKKQPGQRFSWREMEPYTLKLCEALEYAHEQGMVHRDLKPQNVMLTSEDELKLADFGIAAPAGESEDAATGEAARSGTPIYWSPQQAQGYAPVGTDDIYCLGVMLYELLVGQPPFRGPNEAAITRQHIQKPVPDPQMKLTELGGEGKIPGYVNELILKCLAKDPAQRPQGLGEVREWVQAKGDPVVKRQKRMVLVSGVLGVVALVMGGLAIWAWNQRTEAVASRQAEVQQRETAEKQKEIALQEKAKADRENYFNAIARAQTMIADDRYSQAKEILWSAPLKFRAWEWGRLMQLCHPELLTLNGHGSAVTSSSFSFDGKRVVTGSPDRTAKIWDAASGKELLTLKGHTSSVHSATFSFDGKRVVTGSPDRTAKIWDAVSGQELLTLNGHGSTVTAATFSSDGKRVVTGSFDKTAKIWDAVSGKELLTLKGHEERVYSVAFSPSGKRVLTGSHDNTAKIWDAVSGKEVLTISGHGHPVQSVAFSSDGKRVVTGSADKTVKIWDAVSGQELLTLNGHGNAVFSVAFSPSGKRVLTGSHDKTAKIWDTVSGQELLTLKGHEHSVLSVAFSSDGKRVVTGSRDGTAKIWSTVDRRKLNDGFVRSIAFSSDGRRVVTGTVRTTAKIWEIETSRELLTLKGQNSMVTAVDFSPDGKRVVTGGYDTSAKIWDAETGKELLTLKGFGSLSSIAFSPDGKHVVNFRGFKNMTTWDAETGKELLTPKGYKNYVRLAAFSPDGKRVVTGSHGKTAKIWDAETGKELLSLKGPSVNPCAFSPDGKRVVTGSYDNTAKIWDAVSGEELLTLKGHGRDVGCVAFSPDGRRIGTGSFFERTPKIWETVDWTLSREEFPQYQLQRYQSWLKRNQATPKTPASPAIPKK